MPTLHVGFCLLYTSTATNDAAGNVKFTGIKYTVNDLGTDDSGKRKSSNTFNYTVKEVQGSLADVYKRQV